MALPEEVKNAGNLYEKLMLRASTLSKADKGLKIDARHWYLLYYIRQGVDLRQTGYWPQFNELKENIREALCLLLTQELHPHEREGLCRLLNQLKDVFSEQELEKLVQKAIAFCSR